MRNFLDASPCPVGRIKSVAPKNSEGKKKVKIATKFAALTCVGAFGLCGLLPTSVSAGPVPNPDPTVFLDDVDGSGFFVPLGPVLVIEAFDLFEFFGVPSGLSFGFYFESAPGSLIEIFDPSDDFTTTPSSAVAVIDFGGGFVFDIDAGPIVQSSFTPTAGAIGFYLDNPFDLAPPVFSDPLANGGLDVTSTFPLIINPTVMLMTFGIDTPGGVVPLAFEVLAGITPAVVPLPAAAWMGLSMLGGLGVTHLVRRRLSAS